MEKGQSLTVGALAVVAINVVLYLLHLALAGTFALPPGVLAVAAPLEPLAVVLAGWATHGLLSGDWSPPVFPTKAQAHLRR